MERNREKNRSTVEVPAGRLRNQSAYIQFSTRLFGGLFPTSKGHNRTAREIALSKIPWTLKEFLSAVTLSIIIFSAATVVLGLVFALKMPHFAFLIFAASFLVIIAFLAVLLEIPNLVTGGRVRDINAKLPVAIAFVATLASADVSVDEIMHELGEATEFGEISREARSISASSRMFGKDIITAIKDSCATSPSPRLADFLQGINTTVTTGGNLKVYFTAKSKEYYGQQENQIKKNSESVGIMSESYITVGVAFPLILMIILGVVGALSPVSPRSILLFLYLIALVLIPVLAIFFTYILRSTLKEVDT